MGEEVVMAWLSDKVAGMVVFAMGVSAAQQLRVAATDMYPPRLRSS